MIKVVSTVQRVSKQCHILYCLTHGTDTTWPPFCRRHFHTRFLELKLSFVLSKCHWSRSNWQQVNTGSGNSLVPYRRQTITWTSIDTDIWRYISSLCHNELEQTIYNGPSLGFISQATMAVITTTSCATSESSSSSLSLSLFRFHAKIDFVHHWPTPPPEYNKMPDTAWSTQAYQNN